MAKLDGVERRHVWKPKRPTGRRRARPALPAHTNPTPGGTARLEKGGMAKPEERAMAKLGKGTMAKPEEGAMAKLDGVERRHAIRKWAEGGKSCASCRACRTRTRPRSACPAATQPSQCGPANREWRRL